MTKLGRRDFIQLAAGTVVGLIMAKGLPNGPLGPDYARMKQIDIPKPRSGEIFSLMHDTLPITIQYVSGSVEGVTPVYWNVLHGPDRVPLFKNNIVDNIEINNQPLYVRTSGPIFIQILEAPRHSTMLSVSLFI